MNIIGKILLIYCTVASGFIMLALVMARDASSAPIFLFLLPLPLYFVIYSFNQLRSKNSDFGLTFNKAVVFLIFFTLLFGLSIYKVTSPKPSVPINSPSPSPKSTIQLLRATKARDIYENNSTDSAVIGEAKVGDVFVFENFESGWYQVQLENQQKGFIEDSGVEKLD